MRAPTPHISLQPRPGGAGSSAFAGGINGSAWLSSSRSTFAVRCLSPLVPLTTQFDTHAITNPEKEGTGDLWKGQSSKASERRVPLGLPHSSAFGVNSSRCATICSAAIPSYSNLFAEGATARLPSPDVQRSMFNVLSRKHPFQIRSPERAADDSPGSVREAAATRGNDPNKPHFFVIRTREGE
jgi:hypothetical protein